jgi:hypothetical protein
MTHLNIDLLSEKQAVRLTVRSPDLVLELLDVDTLRLVSHFAIRPLRRTSQKHDITLLSQASFAFGHVLEGQDLQSAYETVYRQWLAVCNQQSGHAWQNMPDKGQSFAQRILKAFQHQLNQPAFERAFLQHFFGDSDAHWICKVPRLPELAFSDISLTGRSTIPMLSITQPTVLVQDPTVRSGIRLDAPLSNGGTLIGTISDTAHAQGFAVRFDWSFIPPTHQRLLLESAE